MRPFVTLLAVFIYSAPALALTATNVKTIDCSELTHRKSAASSTTQIISITNDTGSTLNLYWLNFQAEKKSYGTIQANQTRSISTFSGHIWFLVDPKGSCLAAYEVNDGGAPVEAKHASEHVTMNSSEDNGIVFESSMSVSPEALVRAKSIVDQMLANLPNVREKMKSRGFKVEIIGKEEVLTDLPDYAYLRGRKTKDGRDYDTGTRGLGGGDKCSIGEENLLCQQRQPYPAEDIMIHEFSHSINGNVDLETAAAIVAAYQNAMAKNLYPKNCYMARDAGEYWAEGNQSWFDATLRMDVNGGINTQQKLIDHDPMLVAILKKLYGAARVSRYQDCRY